MTAAPAFRGWSIDTDVDAKTTLIRMARLATKALNDPAVIYAANNVIAIAHARDYPAQVGAIRAFMNSYFKFVTNPIGTQTIRPPAFLLNDMQTRGFTQGACDDAALLIATLGMANGIPARFRAIAFGDRSAPFTHVIADLNDGEDWVPLDVTRPYDLSRAPDVARTLTLEV